MMQVLAQVLYFGLALAIGINDTYFKNAPHYTATDILLRVLILLPLIFVIVQGKSKYANVLRKTLCLVMLADVLLPLAFPAGMVVFLIVHIFNSYNFSQYIEFSKEKLLSILIPLLVTYGVALSLYFFFLFPKEGKLYEILTGVYLIPVTLAWSFSITNRVQNKTTWALLTSIGMFLFFLTDFQVAAEFLASANIPLYGFVNAFTYYIGLYLLSAPTKAVTE